MSNTLFIIENAAYTRLCKQAELSKIQLEIETLMQDWYEDDIQLNFTTLAVVEALANVFEHASTSEEQLKPEERLTPDVTLMIGKVDNVITALVTDNGRSIPDTALKTISQSSIDMPEISVNQEQLPDSGWGLNLIKHATTSLNYSRYDKKNYLELTFDCTTSL